jgi:hypothetical protein
MQYNNKYNISTRILDLIKYNNKDNREKLKKIIEDRKNSHIVCNAILYIYYSDDIWVKFIDKYEFYQFIIDTQDKFGNINIGKRLHEIIQKYPIFNYKLLKLHKLEAKYNFIDFDTGRRSPIIREILSRTNHIPRLDLLNSIGDILSKRMGYEYYSISKRDIRFIMANIEKLEMIIHGFLNNWESTIKNIRLFKYMIRNELIQKWSHDYYWNNRISENIKALLIIVKYTNINITIYPCVECSVDNYNCKDIYGNRILCVFICYFIPLLVRRQPPNFQFMNGKDMLNLLYKSMQCFTTKNITKTILYYV